MKTALFVLLCFFYGCRDSGSFTKEQIRQVIKNHSWPGPILRTETYRGCETVPATGKKPQFEGTEFTGQPCSVTVRPGPTAESAAYDEGRASDVARHSQEAEVSFIAGVVAPITLIESGADTFIALLNEDEALLIQHRDGKVVSVTQTGYDNKGHLNYGRSGEGSFIKACLLTESEPCVY